MKRAVEHADVGVGGDDDRAAWLQVAHPWLRVTRTWLRVFRPANQDCPDDIAFGARLVSSSRGIAAATIGELAAVPATITPSRDDLTDERYIDAKEAAQAAGQLVTARPGGRRVAGDQQARRCAAVLRQQRRVGHDRIAQPEVVAVFGGGRPAQDQDAERDARQAADRPGHG